LALSSTSPNDSPSAGDFGVYVHFPWCLSKCPYCDFVAFAAPRSSIDGAAYTDAVLAELAARSIGLENRRLASIFFGGGTPSLWGAAEIARVIDAVVRAFPCDTNAEISLECDPSSLDEDGARALVHAGVNRLSIGIQALDDERLRFLGRIHTREEAIAAVRAAVRGVTHVSAYSLTIEQGTPFGQLARRGRLPLCDDAVMAESFFAIDEALASAGLVHYEVSNYAKPGNEARHNLGYWQGRDYLGLGCGAYGTLRSPEGALRYRNHATPRAYLHAANSALASADDARHARSTAAFTSSEERLDAAALLRERIMLGLRMRQGFDLEAAALELGTDPYPGQRRTALTQLETRGRVVLSHGRITVPRAAWIWVDDTAAALF
jgi:oxygen-independent coproporphyrinogen-3 oxidase